MEEYSPCKNFSFLAAPSGKRTGELKTFSGQEGVVKRVSGITVPGIFQTDIFLQEGKEIATGSFRRSHFPISRDRGNVNTYRSLTYYTLRSNTNRLSEFSKFSFFFKRVN